MSTTLVIHQGDCLEQLRAMPAESVQCCVTSPPYYGLRDYGHKKQIGLEKSPAEFVAALVAVFREVHRVLRKDGTLWVNLGDSYAGSGRGVGGPVGDHSTLQGATANHERAKEAGIRAQSRIGSRHGDPVHTCYAPPPKGSCLPAGFHENARQAGSVGRAWVKPPGGFKCKDILGMPWRVAFALQSDGWYLRQDIIWSKPNPMPESVTDRCTKAHEYIFLLSKSARYHFEAAAISEAAIYAPGERLPEQAENNRAAPTAVVAGKRVRPRSSVPKGHFAGKTNALAGREAFRAVTATRNKRSVWTVPSQPYSGAHFATFPPELIRPCILAGCPRGGVVLDPFGGSGTTGAVALELGRSAVLCELNPDYVRLIRQRCEKSRPHWSAPIPQDLPSEELPLFATGS